MSRRTGDPPQDVCRRTRDFRPVPAVRPMTHDRDMSPPVSVELLDHDAAVALLGRRGVCRVVFTADALPAVLPVNYAVEAESIVLSTGRDSRLATAAAGGVLAIQVDDLDPVSRTGWSVVVTGAASLIPGGPDWERLRQLVDQWVPQRDEVGIRVPMTVVSGRRLVAGTLTSS